MDHLTLTQHKPAASVLWAAITTPPIAFHDFGVRASRSESRMMLSII